MIKKAAIVCAVSLLSAAGLFAQAVPTVATVNVQRVLNDYAEFQTAVERVRGSVAPVEEEMKKMQERVQEILDKGREAEANANNPALDPESREAAQAEVDELQQQLNDENRKLQQFRAQAQGLAEKGQREELQPLQQKALETIREVAQDKGATLVLPLNKVAYADDSLEITDAVIAVLNASSEAASVEE
jgi:Skp family chaperone for outer membrane proteins